MPLAAEKLVDWGTAQLVGSKVAGLGTRLSPLDRARLFEDFGELVPEAEQMVGSFTLLHPGSSRARALVMTRDEWLAANLRGFERILEPFARKMTSARPDGPLAGARRRVLGAQLGGLLGYLGHRVLGQYDMFLPPDDEGLIYFVGANVAGIERKFHFQRREFRMWIALHEVTHRLQFGEAPWLRGYLTGLMDSYLEAMEIDSGWLVDRLRSALAELKSGRRDAQGLGWFFMLMTPDQRELVRQMQSAMSLLEGHASFVMDLISLDRIPSAGRFRRTLHQRRSKAGVEKAFQRAIGFDVKVRQYDLGQQFVSQVVERVGMEGFNRIWAGPGTLPTMDEIGRPDDWVARVHAT